MEPVGRVAVVMPSNGSSDGSVEYLRADGDLSRAWRRLGEAGDGR